MKSIDIFCASPASTAICSSMDHRSMVRTIDRRHMHRGSSPRSRYHPNAAPCSSHLPFDPSHPFRKPATSAKRTETLRRKSSADADGLSRSPRGSSRHLLSDTPFFDIVTDPERGLVSGQAYTIRDRYGDKQIYDRMNQDGIKGGFRSLSTNSSTPRNPAVRLKDHLNAQKPQSKQQQQQVVVELWVSIHCKGCEGKLRKHISRMEGVTSFSIDLGTKKVIVIGDVTPVGVLSSISKVKNAQFWPSPVPTATSSSSSTSTSTSTPRVSLTR